MKLKRFPGAGGLFPGKIVDNSEAAINIERYLLNVKYLDTWRQKTDLDLLSVLKLQSHEKEFQFSFLTLERKIRNLANLEAWS